MDREQYPAVAILSSSVLILLSHFLMIETEDIRQPL